MTTKKFYTFAEIKNLFDVFHRVKNAKLIGDNEINFGMYDETTLENKISDEIKKILKPMTEEEFDKLGDYVAGDNNEGDYRIYIRKL